MTKRGRKSSGELAIRPVSPLDKVERPASPDELSDEEAEERIATVNRLPADWFSRETYPLLIQYCRHVVTARRVRQIIDKLEAEKDFDLKAYEAALKMQARESQIITTLATKMRISQQSTHDKSKKKGDGGKASPGMFKLAATEIEPVRFRREGACRVFRESGTAMAKQIIGTLKPGDDVCGRGHRLEIDWVRISAKVCAAMMAVWLRLSAAEIGCVSIMMRPRLLPFISRPDGRQAKCRGDNSRAAFRRRGRLRNARRADMSGGTRFEAREALISGYRLVRFY